jgi:translocation and assembly module TamB
VVGQSLQFTSGRISFDGAGVRNRIDPRLDLEAQQMTGAITATVRVEGYASQPRIQLSSTPNYPQDEILAQMLFQQSTAQLSPIQLAQIAQAALSLTGAGAGYDPVGSLRRSFGLDRLAVSSIGTAAPGETQTAIAAGKYVAPNIYVGAKQGIGGGTQAEVQIDLTRGLKLLGTLQAAPDAAVTQGAKRRDSTNGIGLSYQFEY